MREVISGRPVHLTCKENAKQSVMDVADKKRLQYVRVVKTHESQTKENEGKTLR